MSNWLTVNKLLKLCLKQVEKWNWEKYIWISDDDEWNGYHQLFFWFTDDADEIRELDDNDIISYDEDDYNNIVVLW